MKCPSLKSMPSFLPPYSTKDVNKLSLGLGVIIGPGTVVSNVIKLVYDVTKIVFYGLRNINYIKSYNYDFFKKAEKVWKEEYSATYRPVLQETRIENKSTFEATISNDYFHDLDRYKLNLHVAERHSGRFAKDYVETYTNLSNSDRRKVALDHALEDAVQHISYIGIGLIRTVPVLGAASILIYKNRSKTVASPLYKNSENCISCQVDRERVVEHFGLLTEERDLLLVSE